MVFSSCIGALRNYRIQMICQHALCETGSKLELVPVKLDLESRMDI
jgi:hypothetical protein